VLAEELPLTSCAGEHRRFPRIPCTGTAGVQMTAGETFFPATMMGLCASGCLMALQKPQRLSQVAFIELRFQVNHLPIRVRGQVRGIRSAISAGFSFPLLSETVRMQLEDLVAQLLKNFVKRHSNRADLR